MLIENLEKLCIQAKKNGNLESLINDLWSVFSWTGGDGRFMEVL